MPGIVTGAPRVLLRLEALCILAVACMAYARQGEGWWLFAVLFFAPDLSMLGYLAGPRAGAVLYNLAHWYSPALICVAAGALMGTPPVLGAGLIWMAHIGFDRALGYGLKYPEGFAVSHLGTMGRV